MIRALVALVALSGLAACGGGSNYSSNSAGSYRAPVVLFAKGPIQRACIADGRKTANAARCGCVQAVADRSLSNADQRRGAKMFKDPHKLQEIRQSSNPNNERFWLAWKAFGQDAASLCATT